MWILLKDFLLVSMGMGIGVVLMCILNVGKEGRGWCIAFSEGSSPEGCDFPQSWSASNQTGDATLPLRWLPPATLLWTCPLGTPCAASCSQPTSKIWLDLKFLFSYP